MDYMRRIAERKIQEAMDNGEFDRLPGAGKPLPPDDADGVPEEYRMSYKIMKNAGYLPEEMQLRKEMLTLTDLLAACRDTDEAARLREKLTARKLRYDTIMSDRQWNASDAFLQYASRIERKLT